MRSIRAAILFVLTTSIPTSTMAQTLTPDELAACHDPDLAADTAQPVITCRADIATFCARVRLSPGDVPPPSDCVSSALWALAWCRTPANREQPRCVSLLNRVATTAEGLPQRPLGVRAAGIVPAAPDLVTNFANGWVDFALSRAEAEVGLMMQRAFADSLCGSSAPAWVRDSFVRTCDALHYDSRDTPDLSSLASALQADMRALPEHLVLQMLSGLDRSVACFGYAATHVAVIELGADFSIALPDAIAQTTSMTPDPSCSATWDGTVVPALTLFAEVITDAARQRDTHDALRYADVQDVLASVRLAHPSADLSALEPALAAVQQLVNAIHDAHNGTGAPDTLRDRVVDGTIATISALVDLGLGAAPTADARQSAAAVKSVVHAVGSLIEGHSLDAIVEMLTGPTLDVLLAHEDSPTLRRFAHAARALGAVMQAESSEQVRQILEANAAPIGSWREYRRRPFAGFISTAVGASFAVELAPGTSGPYGSAGLAVAPWLPIGFEVNLLSGDFPFLLMIPLIDVGALASARLDGRSGQATDGRALTEAHLDIVTILSPGLLFGVGLGDTPLALYFGAVVAPSAREYFLCPAGGVCADHQAQTTYRFQISLAVDLPVFPLF